MTDAGKPQAPMQLRICVIAIGGGGRQNFTATPCFQGENSKKTIHCGIMRLHIGIVFQIIMVILLIWIYIRSITWWEHVQLQDSYTEAHYQPTLQNEKVFLNYLSDEVIIRQQSGLNTFAEESL